VVRAMNQDKLAESDNWSNSYKPQQGSRVIGVKWQKSAVLRNSRRFRVHSSFTLAVLGVGREIRHARTIS
jgi:hypothetical protein